MKLTTITVLFALVAFFEIWRAVIRVRRETMGIRSALVWVFMWSCIGVFSFFPDLLDAAMRLAQMEKRMFFILILAVFVLFAFVFNLVSRMDRLERNMSRLIQEIAMLNYKLGGKPESHNGHNQ